MVSAYLADALRDPTAELKELFSKNALSTDFPQEVAKHFSTVFSSDVAFKQIPVLNAQCPPNVHRDRALVRYRAMVQDTSPGSEMYLRKTSTGTMGGWGIHEEIGQDHSRAMDFSELRECNVSWAVSVPGEARWCADELDGPPETSASEPYASTRLYKGPTQEAAQLGVQVKIYDLTIAEKLKSTDLATFVGILTREPLDLDAESPSEVPTLHVLFVLAHQDSIISRPYPSEANAPRLREELLEWIATEALGGDREAAEWVLISCIAKVQSRNPPLLPPSITLTHFPSPPTLATTPDQSSSRSDAPLPLTSIPVLAHILGQLVPLSRTLPLSLEYLNRVPFSPESKEEDLHAGVLQLPKGSSLLITEGGVREGKLLERGLNNINALQEVMASQTLGYIFPFSRFSFPTDLACIVLSEGSKSTFFKTDIIVPFQPKSSTAEDIFKLYKPAEDVTLPPADKLAAFRDLVVGAQQGKVRVNETTSEFIQNEFVRDRQQNASVTSDDLIRRMTIAKLYALSLHEQELTIDTWERAKALDERRKTRLEKA